MGINLWKRWIYSALCKLDPAHYSLIFALLAFSYCAIFLPNEDLGIPTASCRLPHLNPWDPSIMPYYFKLPPLECHLYAPTPFYIIQDLDSDALKLEGETADVSCKYRTISGDGDYHVKYGDSVDIDHFPFLNKWPKESDFIEITCHHSVSKQTYIDIFSHIQPKMEPDPDVDSKWNIAIIGIDSLSYLNAIRQLPKSMKKLQDSDALIFKGANKVGENTFPNLVGLLTGERIELNSGETLSKRLPHDGKKQTFDNYPLIWNEFKDAKYSTLFSEDFPRSGAFQNNRKGFSQQPTDHYGRTMFLGFENLLDDNGRYFVPWLKELEHHHIQLNSVPTMCFQNRAKHNIVWNYSIRQFVKTYSGRNPFCALSWLVEPGHDHINPISQMDDDLVELLNMLERQKASKRTFVFVLADHGSRTDAYVFLVSFLVFANLFLF